MTLSSLVEGLGLVAGLASTIERGDTSGVCRSTQPAEAATTNLRRSCALLESMRGHRRRIMSHRKRATLGSLCAMAAAEPSTRLYSPQTAGDSRTRR
jgi:hypothetical protein